jgi:recombination protein RecA
MDIMGNRVRIKVVKNKVAPPFRQCEFDILYGQGVSKDGEIVDLASDLNIIKKSGSWYSYGETKLGQGRDAVKQLFADNPELAEEIEGKIRQATKPSVAPEPEAPAA